MLTALALRNRVLTLSLLIASILFGIIGLTSHPSREDPAITIRNASVIARFPGMSASRIEQLITTKLEEKVREIPQVDTIGIHFFDRTGARQDHAGRQICECCAHLGRSPQ